MVVEFLSDYFDDRILISLIAYPYKPPANLVDSSSSLCYSRYRTTLETTGSIEDGGGMNWKLVGCLVGAWVLLFVIVFRGVQSVGKVRNCFVLIRGTLFSEILPTCTMPVFMMVVRCD